MENTASLEYSFDAFAFCLLWQHSVVQHSGVLEMFASTESLLHSVIRPNCYSHSCTLPGQLFVQQHNKLDQCPDPARETVFSFVSGCWVFFVLVRFRVLGVVFLCLVLVIFKICVSTWAWCRQENKHWDRGQYQQSPWKESLKSIHAKTMLFLCCWFHTSAFLLCIGVCVVTKWVWFDGSSGLMLLWANCSLSITALAVTPGQARCTAGDCPTAGTAWMDLHCHRTHPEYLPGLWKMLCEECFIHWYHYKWSDFLLKLSPLLPWGCGLFHILCCCYFVQPL